MSLQNVLAGCQAHSASTSVTSKATVSNADPLLQVLSGKGGVGKSSVTTQLALSLSLAGKSVGILDIDLTGPSIPRLLGLEDAKIIQAPGGWVPVEVHRAQTLPALPPDLVFRDGESTVGSAEGTTNGTSHPSPTMSASQAANGSSTSKAPKDPTPPIGTLRAISLAFLLPSRSSAVVWRGPKKTAMVRQFLTDVLWPRLDYLLIDTPPGTSDEHISLVETLLKNTHPPSLSPMAKLHPLLSGAVIVTTPQAVAVSDVRKEVNFCRKVDVPILGVVENMSGYICECCGEKTNLFGKGGGETMSGEFGVKFLGSVPLDQQWGVIVEEGGWGRYGKVDNSEISGENGERDERIRSNGHGQEEKETRREGLLVDRYRSCSLSGVFQEIAKQLVEVVEAQNNDA